MSQCRGCGSELPLSTKRNCNPRQYCSAQCRHQHNRRPCPKCGVLCAPTSRECLGCWLARGRKPAVCRWCGVTYKPKACKLRSFCSRDHYFAFIRARRIVIADQRAETLADVLSVQRGVTVEIVLSTHRSFVCCECGKAMSVLRSRCKGGHKYCSVECRRRAARRQSRISRLFPDWPKDRAIPVELVRARVLLGQTIWFLSDRDRYERFHRENPSAPGIGV